MENLPLEMRETRFRIRGKSQDNRAAVAQFDSPLNRPD